MNEQPARPVPHPSPKPPGSALQWADRLRNLATVLVIVIHVAAPIAHAYPDVNTWWWWTGNWWNALGRPAVPLFVMLSGYLLLSKDYPLFSFLQKRFTRIVVPAMFWMGAYLLYGHLAKNDPASIGQALRYMVIGPVHYHLWFIYLILGLYLVYPVLRPWARSASERDLLYFLVLCAIGTWGYKLLYTFFDLPIGINFELVTNNCGYFVLGYYLGQKTASDAPAPHMPWPYTRRQLAYGGLALAALGTTATALLSYHFSTEPGKVFIFFYDYLTPNVTIAAFGWFMFAKMALDRRPMLDIEKDFAAASFGIYFCHVLVMDWWGQCGYWHSKVHPAKGIPILVALIVCMSFLMIALLRSLPGGKKVT
jgi:surface polysaccharide O-acyltransferase-like enzyme